MLQDSTTFRFSYCAFLSILLASVVPGSTQHEVFNSRLKSYYERREPRPSSLTPKKKKKLKKKKEKEKKENE